MAGFTSVRPSTYPLMNGFNDADSRASHSPTAASLFCSVASMLASQPAKSRSIAVPVIFTANNSSTRVHTVSAAFLGILPSRTVCRLPSASTN
ncbi:MAG TPA: hypothetical protein VGI75_08450 [Pirellulales bacterium]